MRRQGFRNLRQASPVQTAALAVLPAAHAAQATLSRQEAQQLLHQWERVKKEALGSAPCPCRSAKLHTYARTRRVLSLCPLLNMGQVGTGAERAVGRLQEVLDGGMLKEAVQGARALKQNNM